MKTGAPRMMVIASFAAIYVIWGSTYLAIRIGLETLPPFLLCAGRFVLPGIGLYLWLRLRGAPRPSNRQWWWAVVTGAIMLVGASGGLVWAEQRIPSAVAALLFTTVPLWMIVLDAVLQRSFRGGWRTAVGLTLGLGGVSVLVSPSSRELLGVDPLGAVVILGAALSWSVGSLVSRRVELPSSPMMTVAVQMMAGGVILLLISAGAGEWQVGSPLSQVSLRSTLALLYLAFFGALVGLSAYTYLLRAVSAAAISTYAFVNPVLAVVLGWLIAREPMGPGVFAAAAMIVTAVVLIQSTGWVRPAAKPKFAAGVAAWASSRRIGVRPVGARAVD